MKRLLVIMVFLGMLMNPAFSQKKLQLKIDTTFSKLSAFGNPNSFSLKDTSEFKLRFKSPFKYENRLLQDSVRKSFRPGPKMNVMISRWDNMPVYNPPGHFPILSYRPDSATRYSMPILRIK